MTHTHALPTDPRERDLALLLHAVHIHGALLTHEIALRETICDLLEKLCEVRERRLVFEGETNDDGEVVRPGAVRVALHRVNVGRLTEEAALREEHRLEGFSHGERAWDRFERLSDKRQAHAWAELAG